MIVDLSKDLSVTIGISGISASSWFRVISLFSLINSPKVFPLTGDFNVLYVSAAFSQKSFCFLVKPSSSLYWVTCFLTPTSTNDETGLVMSSFSGI